MSDGINLQEQEQGKVRVKVTLAQEKINQLVNYALFYTMSYDHSLSEADRQLLAWLHAGDYALEGLEEITKSATSELEELVQEAMQDCLGENNDIDFIVKRKDDIIQKVVEDGWGRFSMSSIRTTVDNIYIEQFGACTLEDAARYWAKKLCEEASGDRSKFIRAIRGLRSEIGSLGLKEAKDLMDQAFDNYKRTHPGT